VNAACRTVAGGPVHLITVTCKCGYTSDQLRIDAAGVVCVCIGCGARSRITAVTGPDEVRVRFDEEKPPAMRIQDPGPSKYDYEPEELPNEEQNFPGVV